MTATSDKFCLNWNDFQNNISSTFLEMRDDLDLADVTLACEDKKQFQAHKFVLSTSSPFFKEILRTNKHPHPLIYLKGMRASALESILDFVYRGEVNIYQEDLNNFLKAAEELELKGLAGQHCLEEDNINETNCREETLKLKVEPNPRDMVLPKMEAMFSEADVQDVGKFEKAFNSSIDMMAVEHPINTNNHNLKETVKSLLTQVGDTWSCTICGQKSTYKIAIKRHIASRHTTGGYHPCKLCGKIFRFKHSINTHMFKSHPK